MRPTITLHMTSSIDGHTLVPRWHPADVVAPNLWQELYGRLDIPNRILGRSTGEETGRTEPYPTADDVFPREDHIVSTRDSGWRIVIDTHGKLSWTDVNTNGAHLAIVLTDDIPDSHLAGLRRDNISYIFAGGTDLDLHLLVDKLGTKLGITETLLSGGPATSGAFLRAGLIDNISLLLAPTIDGADDSPTMFSGGTVTGHDTFPVTGIELESVERLERGMLWMRYTVSNRD